MGTLFKQPLGELMGKKEEMAHGFGLKQAPDVLVKMSRLAVPAFPDSQRRELQPMAEGVGLESRYAGFCEHHVRNFALSGLLDAGG